MQNSVNACYGVIISIILLYIKVYDVHTLKRRIVSDSLKSTKSFRSLFNHTRGRTHYCYNTSITHGSSSTNLYIILQLGFAETFHRRIDWCTGIHSSKCVWVYAYYYFYYCITLFSTDWSFLHSIYMLHTHVYIIQYIYYDIVIYHATNYQTTVLCGQTGYGCV